MLLGLPLSFAVAVAESPEFDVHRSPLGRLAFIAGSLVMAIFSHYVLHPKRGLLLTVAERPDVSWFWKKPRLWYLLAVAGPVALAVIAAIGYFYTALELAWRLHAMMWLLLGLLIVQAFAQRCLLVARRKLAIKQARERREAAMAHAQAMRASRHRRTGACYRRSAGRPDVDRSADASAAAQLRQHRSDRRLLVDLDRCAAGIGHSGPFSVVALPIDHSIKMLPVVTRL